ncbi:MAG TPA: hypothetical protein VK779_07670 [Rhizomicrobium sp.]|nr:hypothetical protein [Rhizomicrobium sp.]
MRTLYNQFNKVLKQMYRLEIIQIDDELGVVLPDELAARLNLTAGSAMIATSDSGGFLLTLEHPSSEPRPTFAGTT